MRHAIILGTTFLVATTAIAHEGVTNKAVMARMETMVEMKEAIQTLGKMANQATPFDPAIATQAKAKMIAATSRIIEDFEAEETDPKMQAKPAIWSNWADFETKALQSVAASKQVQTDALGDLQQSLAPLGDSCSSCHKAYRVKKK